MFFDAQDAIRDELSPEQVRTHFDVLAGAGIARCLEYCSEQLRGPGIELERVELADTVATAVLAGAHDGGEVALIVPVSDGEPGACGLGPAIALETFRTLHSLTGSGKLRGLRCGVRLILCGKESAAVSYFDQNREIARRTRAALTLCGGRNDTGCDVQVSERSYGPDKSLLCHLIQEIGFWCFGVNLDWNGEACQHHASLVSDPRIGIPAATMIVNSQLSDESAGEKLGQVCRGAGTYLHFLASAGADEIRSLLDDAAGIAAAYLIGSSQIIDDGPLDRQETGAELEFRHACIRHVESAERQALASARKLCPELDEAVLDARFEQLRDARNLAMKRTLTILRERSGLDRIRIPKPRRTPPERKAARLFPCRSEYSDALFEAQASHPWLMSANGDASLLDICKQWAFIAPNEYSNIEGLIEIAGSFEEAGLLRFVPVVSRRAIISAIGDVGVVPPADLLVFDFSQTLGHLRGGAAAVANALRRSAGTEGCVLMPGGGAAAEALAKGKGRQDRDVGGVRLHAAGRTARKILKSWPEAKPDVLILGVPNDEEPTGDWFALLGVEEETATWSDIIAGVDKAGGTSVALGEGAVRLIGWDDALNATNEL